MSCFCFSYIPYYYYISAIDLEIYNLKILCSHLFTIDGAIKLHSVLYNNQNLLVYSLNSQRLCAIKLAKF